MSTINDIFVMNKAFGYNFGDKNNIKREDIIKQLRCVNDEVQEGIDAANLNDTVEICDAIGDILVFAIGAFYKAGISEEKAELIMAEIFKSNMSKFCETDENLEDTIMKYVDLGVLVVPSGKGKYRHVRTILGTIQVDINGKVYQPDKFLKGVNFKQPQIKEIIFN